MSGVLKKDDNGYPVAGGVSSADPNAVLNATIDSSTGRLLVASSGAAGTVTSVASADGSITVTNPTTTVDLSVVKAPKWTTARNLAGNSVDGSANVAFSNKFIVQGTTDAGLSGAQFLGALGTGILKNTTTTGVLSIATGPDLPTMTASAGGAVPTPPNNTTTFLRGDGTFATPAGSGTVNSGTAGQMAYYATSTTAVSGNTNANISNGALTLGVGGSTIGQLLLANTTSGATTLSPGATAAGTLTLPAGTDTLIGKATTDTLTNKTYDTAGTGNVFKINGTGITAVTGSGSVVLGTTPTIATPVINGLATGTGVSSSATASTLMTRDSSANASADNFLEGYTTVTTAAGTTTLTVDSTYFQFFTGSTTQTVTLPVASTLVLGQSFMIVNNSTGAVTVNSSGANAVIILAGSTSALVTCILTSGTTAASWSVAYNGVVTTSGKALTVSNSLTLAGTDGKGINVGAATANKILVGDGTNMVLSTPTFPNASATSGKIIKSDGTNWVASTETYAAPGTSGNVLTSDGTNWTSAAPVVTASNTVTFTNKRITKRTGTTTSSATPTINTDNVDFYSLTAQAVDITSFTTNLTGTPTEAQTLWIAITGTSARAITWGSSFESSTVTLPTTTVSTNRLDVGFVWNTVTSKWRCVATC